MERHSHLTNSALVMSSSNSCDLLGRAVFMQHYTGVSFAMYTSAFDAAGGRKEGEKGSELFN
jgi:hypothetical protein